MQRVLEALSVLKTPIIGTLAVVILAVALLAMLVLIGRIQAGFTAKTIWDWMEVLGVPLTVAVIGGLFVLGAQRANRRAEAERELAIEQAREATLRAYLDRMSDLVLSHKLQELLQDSPVRAVADARTLAALRDLDGRRKGLVVRYLHECRLIAKDKPVVSLRLADLSGADLGGANLEASDLSGANLGDADFYGANLRDANLRSAVLSEEELSKAGDLVCATMPDGTEMTEDRWNALKAS